MMMMMMMQPNGAVQVQELAGSPTLAWPTLYIQWKFTTEQKRFLFF